MKAMVGRFVEGGKVLRQEGFCFCYSGKFEG